MMWRPITERSCRSSRLLTGPSCPRLVSIVPPSGQPSPLVARRRPFCTMWVKRSFIDSRQIPMAHADRVRCDAVPTEHPEPRLSGWKVHSAQPAGRSLLMPQQSTDPSWASRLSSPSPRDANTSSPAAAVPASVGPAELPELSDPATAGRTRWGRRSRSSGPSESGRTGSSRRSTATRRTELGVRRPHIAQMPDDRREQAISAIADLLVVQLEREAQRSAFSASGGGRVAGRNVRQEELP